MFGFEYFFQMFFITIGDKVIEIVSGLCEDFIYCL
jgi:hypothetical protein